MKQKMLENFSAILFFYVSSFFIFRVGLFSLFYHDRVSLMFYIFRLREATQTTKNSKSFLNKGVFVRINKKPNQQEAESTRGTLRTKLPLDNSCTTRNNQTKTCQRTWTTNGKVRGRGGTKGHTRIKVVDPKWTRESPDQ